MKKIIDDYSIALDKILKEYKSDLNEEELEDVISYINVLEHNLHLFKRLIKDKNQIEHMINHIAQLGDKKWQEKN